MTTTPAPNRYDELDPITRPIIDRLINALASSPDTAADIAASLVFTYAARARASADRAYVAVRATTNDDDDDVDDAYATYDDALAAAIEEHDKADAEAEAVLQDALEGGRARNDSNE